MPLAPGARLGPYEVTAAIGAGGMGEVYRARDARLGRDVAIKVLPASFAFDAERLSRFEIEARATGQLNHPNVVSVFDLGTYERAPYLVTELLEGDTLRARLADGGLPLRKVMDLGAQMARGLAAAHEKGIVHRDLKPENVFITKDGRLKILDFGLARVLAPDSPVENAATALQATNPGTVLGTVGYMSPEQVRGKPADVRSDVFAFGAILLEMLTGARAFQRDSAADTMAAILKEDPAATSASGILAPPAVERVIRRCLEKNPEERFQSARDLGFALEAIGADSQSAATVTLPSGSGSVAPIASEARATKPRSGARVAATIAAAAILLAVGAIAGRVFLVPAAGAAGAGGIKLRQLTFSGGLPATQPALSPDGQTFLYVSGAPNAQHIWLQRVGGENPIDLTKDSSAASSAPAFSPDGKFIAFRSERDGGGLFVMGATGESIRRITSEGYDPAWSPDGHELAFSQEPISDPSGRQRVSNLFRVPIDTGAPTKILDIDGVQPRWSPDGRFIAFWGLRAGTSRRVLYTVASGGGTPNVILDDGKINWNPTWSTDGAFLYYVSDREPPMSIWRIAMDPATATAHGDPERVTATTEAQFGLSAQAGGAFLFSSRSRVATIQRYAFDLVSGSVSAAPEVLLKSARDIWTVSPSPDGQFLAFNVIDVAEDLEVIKMDGSSSSRITNDSFRDRGPVWYPDSSRILFYSDRGGKYDAWTINRDGSGLRQETKDAGLAEPHMAPDGKSVFSLKVVGAVAVFTFDISVPLEQRVLTAIPKPAPDRDFQPVAWTPDSRHILGNIAARNGTTMAVYSPADKTFRPIAKGTAGALLSDGRTILSIADNHFAFVNIETGAVRQGGAVPPDRVIQAVSADGKWLYEVKQDQLSNVWMLSLTGGAVSRR